MSLFDIDNETKKDLDIAFPSRQLPDWVKDAASGCDADFSVVEIGLPSCELEIKRSNLHTNLSDFLLSSPTFSDKRFSNQDAPIDIVLSSKTGKIAPIRFAEKIALALCGLGGVVSDTYIDVFSLSDKNIFQKTILCIDIAEIAMHKQLQEKEQLICKTKANELTKEEFSKRIEAMRRLSENDAVRFLYCDDPILLDAEIKTMFDMSVIEEDWHGTVTWTDNIPPSFYNRYLTVTREIAARRFMSKVIKCFMPLARALGTVPFYENSAYRDMFDELNELVRIISNNNFHFPESFAELAQRDDTIRKLNALETFLDANIQCLVVDEMNAIESECEFDEAILSNIVEIWCAMAYQVGNEQRLMRIEGDMFVVDKQQLVRVRDENSIDVMADAVAKGVSKEDLLRGFVNNDNELW